MKLPAVAIVAAFASGMALGLHPLVAPQVTSRFFLAACFTSCLVLILAGLAWLLRCLPWRVYTGFNAGENTRSKTKRR